ncbi:MAG: hypothetical protein QNJ41_17930 [Xenococcaceae cyanobacterium MO_188.B32]|nr:hypothetical protein [Xenococcaceae cyanobacterium MO_188.B32]
MKLDCYHVQYDRAENYLRMCNKLYKLQLVREKVKVISARQWTIDELRDYRARYLAMRSYCLDWFKRASEGNIDAPQALIANAKLMWDFYSKSDRYSQLKMIYSYCFRFDYIQNNEIEIIKPEPPRRRKKYKDFKQIYGLFR